MKPAAVAAALVALIAGLAALAGREGPRSTGAPPTASSSAPELTSQCPPGSLPDEGVCIPAPRQTAQRMERSVPGATADSIPRRPDRPADYAAYVMPVDLEGRGSWVSEDVSSLSTALGNELSGIVAKRPRGAAVALPALEGQHGAATVVFSGELVAPTLVTRHRIGNAKDGYDVLVVLGNLEKVVDAKVDAELSNGSQLGTVGDGASIGVTQVFIAMRRVREGVDVATLTVNELFDSAKTIGVDARNLLQTK